MAKFEFKLWQVDPSQPSCWSFERRPCQPAPALLSTGCFCGGVLMWHAAHKGSQDTQGHTATTLGHFKKWEIFPHKCRIWPGMSSAQVNGRDGPNLSNAVNNLTIKRGKIISSSTTMTSDHPHTMPWSDVTTAMAGNVPETPSSRVPTLVWKYINCPSPYCNQPFSSHGGTSSLFLQ